MDFSVIPLITGRIQLQVLCEETQGLKAKLDAAIAAGDPAALTALSNEFVSPGSGADRCSEGEYPGRIGQSANVCYSDNGRFCKHS